MYDADDAHHADVRSLFTTHSEPFLIPVVILAELDDLLETHLGVDAALDLFEAVTLTPFELVELTHTDIMRSRELMEQYRGLGLGYVDACIAATAERLDVVDVLTVDFRHFRVVVPRHATAFKLLPADARA